MVNRSWMFIPGDSDKKLGKALSVGADALILDVRHQDEFVKGHIPQSIFIGLDGGFAPWVGALIKDINQPILLVAPNGREEDTITRLSVFLSLPE